MRVLVLGGTRFVGAAIVEELLAHGHEVVLFHRGNSEPGDLPAVEHLHGDRRDQDRLQRAFTQARPEAVVDTCAYSHDDARPAVDALARAGLAAVVLSSQDVYRAFATMRGGAAATDAVPLDEGSAVRAPDQRCLFRDALLPAELDCDGKTYENLDVEEAYEGVRATILRLPLIYGERDYLRREEPLLRRVRAGRRLIPIGSGGLLWSRGYVRDIASAVRLAVEADSLSGVTLNIAEARTWTMGQWAAKVLAAAGSDAELVQVPDPAVPADLDLTRTPRQHLLMDSTKARRVLRWNDTDSEDALRRSVRWHLDHPPPAGTDEFTADDRALATLR
jgi:nucleoside-diphosphate-sugar epimerase